MKEIKTNIIFMGLGAIVLLFEFIFKLNGTLGWLLTSSGVILVGIGLVYKSKKPIQVLVNLFINFF